MYTHFTNSITNNVWKSIPPPPKKKLPYLLTEVMAFTNFTSPIQGRAFHRFVINRGTVIRNSSMITLKRNFNILKNNF